MAGSEYFLKLFDNNMHKGDSTTTEMKETTYEALRTVLKYIYTHDHRDVLTAGNVLAVYELSGKYLVSALQDQCTWYMQSSSNLEAAVRWYISAKGNAAYEGVQSMLEGKLIKNGATLYERHPDLIDELEGHGLVSSLLKQACRNR